MLRFVRALIVSATITLVLTACGGDATGGSQETHSNEGDSASSIGISVGGAEPGGVVVAANNPPSINGTPATSVIENQPYSFTPNAQDPEKDALIFAITNKPSWASFNTATGSLAGTPGPGHVGTTNNIGITVSDGKASPVALPTFSITVVAANNPPTIGGIPATSVNINQVYLFTPTAEDPDSDTLVFSIANKPSWATFNTTTGSLAGTPDSINIGTTNNIGISVSDGKAPTVALATFSITVTNISSVPVITGTPNTSLYEGTNYSFTPTVEAPDINILDFSITNKPVWASFDRSTGALTGTPTNADIGITSNISISVTDGFSEAVYLSDFSITVESASATLSWVAPTTRTDSTPLPLSEIKGYRIYTGTASNNLTLLIDINDSSITEYTETGLPAGTYYYAVTAYTQFGTESSFSTVASKTIN